MHFQNIKFNYKNRPRRSQPAQLKKNGDGGFVWSLVTIRSQPYISWFPAFPHAQPRSSRSRMKCRIGFVGQERLKALATPCDRCFRPESRAARPAAAGRSSTHSSPTIIDGISIVACSSKRPSRGKGPGGGRSGRRRCAGRRRGFRARPRVRAAPSRHGSGSRPSREPSCRGTRCPEPPG
jgi:hypothetical protein